MVQLLEVLVDKKFEEMSRRLGELTSMVGAYTQAAGQVKAVSIESANSSRIVFQLSTTAAEKLSRGFKENDPLLRAFLDDFKLLDVKPAPDRTTARTDSSRSPKAEPGHSFSSDLTFLTNEPGRTLRDRFAILLREDTFFFDCLVGYFFISGFYKLYPALEKVEKIRILVITSR
jgi:hypothetical protein